MVSNASGPGLADTEEGGVSVGRLYREMVGGVADADGDDAVEQRSEAILETVTDSLFDDGFDFTEETVKANLDEILIMLVALRESQTHGKGLMEDLERVFGAELSPGTVYPRLHALEEEGVLQVQELVRTKEYRIDDPELCRERVEEAMRQHLALGFFFKAALDDL
jgi:hypothetical protein